MSLKDAPLVKWYDLLVWVVVTSSVTFRFSEQKISHIEESEKIIIIIKYNRRQRCRILSISEATKVPKLIRCPYATCLLWKLHDFLSLHMVRSSLTEIVHPMANKELPSLLINVQEIDSLAFDWFKSFFFFKGIFFFYLADSWISIKGR